MATEDLEWERSKISNQDINLMKKLGLMKKKDALRFPSEESYPTPPIQYQVSFVDISSATSLLPSMIFSAVYSLSMGCSFIS
jgi:hypothetical protein